MIFFLNARFTKRKFNQKSTTGPAGYVHEEQRNIVLLLMSILMPVLPNGPKKISEVVWVRSTLVKKVFTDNQFSHVEVKIQKVAFFHIGDVKSIHPIINNIINTPAWYLLAGSTSR